MVFGVFILFLLYLPEVMCCGVDVRTAQLGWDAQWGRGGVAIDFYRKG